jgi:flagellar hook protein FlgE
MLRSMYSGLSGLQASKIVMDVIGNNISNVNTIAFKRARATFKDILYQTLGSATAPAVGSGGTNPQQVGLGTTVGSIDQVLAQGTIQPTNRDTDFSIEGEGYFVLSDGQQSYFTRAGNFDIDADGNLVLASNGFRIIGRAAVNGVIPSTATLSPIQIPLGQQIQGNGTANVSILGNVDRDALAGDTHSTSVDIYDSAGGAHTMTLTFTKSTDNYWKVSSEVTDGTITGATGQSLGLYFDADTGELSSISGTTLSFIPTGMSAQSIDIGFGTPGTMEGITQFANEGDTATISQQDGYTVGSLRTFEVALDGTVTGVYSNGSSMILAGIVLAEFANPGGLTHEGNNLYSTSANSGVARIGTPNGGSLGSLNQGTLERSNVDIAEEFIDMIVTQRGFQANSRVISTSDEMLLELINLKR